ncbi:MAG: alkylmercury lyase family protein [Acidimicrobiia bacterium]
MSRRRVEILYFDGCPNHEPARALVERVAAELGVQPEIDLVHVRDAEAATQRRFLGSPTVRVDGVDVEPGSEERRDFVFSCRVYRSDRGFSGQPDERWIRDALAEGGGVKVDVAGVGSDGELVPGVAATLAAADIPSSKLGAARSARLSEHERDFYFWILRHFATSGRPSPVETRTAAGELGLELESALESLARDDLVHVDATGEIAVTYPFSGHPTVHRVRFPSGREAHAMCAIDALGIAPMFEQPITVDSRDPLTGHEIQVRVGQNGDAQWSPQSAVVVAGAIEREGNSCQSCCPVLNFFASSSNAERWLDEHPYVRGQVITMQEAILAGRAVFGEVLKDD